VNTTNEDQKENTNKIANGNHVAPVVTENKIKKKEYKCREVVRDKE
jgi:hypothetical protein